MPMPLGNHVALPIIDTKDRPTKEALQASLTAHAPCAYLQVIPACSPLQVAGARSLGCRCQGIPRAAQKHCMPQLQDINATTTCAAAVTLAATAAAAAAAAAAPALAAATTAAWWCASTLQRPVATCPCIPPTLLHVPHCVLPRVQHTGHVGNLGGNKAVGAPLLHPMVEALCMGMKER